MIGSIILALAVALGPVSGQQGCSTKVDVTFLLDSSNNVGKDNHQKQLQFVKDTMSKMNIAPDKVQASVVTYGGGVANQFYLNQYQNSSAVQNAITNIPFKAGSTHSVGDAIRYATGTSFSPLHGGRSDAPHVAIVVTNGPSGAIDITKLEAQTARDNGVILYSVGVGNGVDLSELQAIASDPDSRHLFQAQNYDALQSLSDLLAVKICNELPPDPTALQAPTGCLQKADLVFMVDSSSSVGSTNFQKLEHFLKSVVSKIDVAPGKVQVGLVKYGSYPSVEFSFGAYKTRPEVMKAIEGMTYLGGGTNDADAISFTGQQLFSQTSGARGNVPRIAVLITDGGSANPSAAINAANKARTEHIGLMTIGVGNRVNTHELNSIADSSADAFQVSNYDNLDTITNQLINQMCKVRATEPPLATSAPGASLPPDTCVDRLGNCDMYGSQVCKDYQVWAADNCQRFCGICTPLYTPGPPKCQDSLPSCPSYGKDNCQSNPTWAQTNCALFCGFCATNTSSSGYFGQCFYKGQAYNTGDKWYDGCDYECICEDGNTGKYRCNNRCPVYHNMPSDCTLVAQPGQCCLKPVCNFQPTVDKLTASGHGTTPDGIDVCVYKGKQYFQGQSWRDGCDYQCRCIDSKKGIYRCDDVCPSFNSIPPYCHLERKAGECCRKPVCEFSTQTGSFQGAGSISGNGVGATPTAHPPCLDVINTCSQYGKSVCTAYQGWAANNCRKYCDLCPTGLPKPGPNDKCIYGGNFYDQGDSWNTSCSTQCVCENAIYGYYRCVDTCPTYNNLPSGCQTVKNAGDCCPTVQCSNGFFLTSSPNLGSIGNGGQLNVSHPPSGMVQVRPTVTTGQVLLPGTGGTGFQAPTLTGCLYKGQLYVQGQVWDDGCDYTCECSQAYSGLYTCRQKCPTYPLLQPSCVLVVNTNDACCKTPQCSPDPVTHQVPVPIPVFPAAISSHGSVQPPAHQTGGGTGQYSRTVYLVQTGLTPAPPTAPTSFVTGGIGHCTYKGVQYQQGETWEDGCQFNCVCDDATKGHYQCVEKCVHYNNLPPDCHLEKDPSNPCCDRPKCVFPVAFVTDVGEVHTTPSPRGAHCVYNGQSYSQGQTWYDGCSYKCTCEDAINNIYRCLTRCPQYTNIGTNCEFGPDPKDPSCCQRPECYPTGPVNFTACQPPSPSPAGTYVGQGIGLGYCEYKGVHYNQTDKWTDGCDLVCECTDAQTGLYRCQDKCPRYLNLPPYCTLITDFANPCCKIPECDLEACNAQPTLAPQPGSTQAPTPLAPGATHAPGYTPAPTYNKCVYKGVSYGQGQTWEDGCLYNCRCDDADKGLYTCDERCATYNPIPAGCVMMTDPEDSCCLVPSCIPVAQSTVAPISGVSTPSPTPYRIPTAALGQITGSANIPTPIAGSGLPTPAPLKYCVYKGQQYAQGQTWEDGCDYTCECIDAHIGQYRCSEKCIKYVGLPANCRLARDPANPCCQIPECSSTPYLQPTPGPTGFLSPTPAPQPSNVCVYKGVSYTQGQTWYDGCDYICDCENSGTGLYRCNNRCPSYNIAALPKECHMEPSSKDPLCCKEPKCIIVPYTNQTSGFVAVPTPPPGVINGGVATPTPAPTLRPSPGYHPTPKPGVCIYKGNQYQQGQKWKDGCLYNCECLDAMAGRYRCTEMCPIYEELPSGCRLISDYSNPCCKKAYCDISKVPTPAPYGVSTPAPTPKSGCVYNGVMFKQGEQWNDGCDLQCVCEDETTGFYRCSDRCPKYNPPEYCTLVTDPRDSCCKVPSCPSVTPTPKPWVPGMIPTPAPGITFSPNMIPTPGPGLTYAPGMYPTWVPGMVPTPAPGYTFSPYKIPTPAPGQTYAPGMYPIWAPGMVPTPAPGMTFAPDKIPTPAPHQTYAPGMFPTWVPGMVPTPAPGMTYAPNKIPTPAPGQTYAPGMFPTWVPGMVPTPAPGKTFAPNRIPSPGPGLTYAPGMYPTWVPGMIPTPAPGMTYAPDKLPTPASGRTYAPGMYPTWVPGMVPTPAPGYTYAPDKVPTPAPGSTYAPGMYPTWVPGMVPTPAPGMTFAPNKIPTPGPGRTYAPGMYPTWVPGMIPTPAPNVTFAPDKVPTPASGRTYAPGMYPTWVPGMVPTPAPGYTYPPYLIPTPAPGKTYAPGMFPVPTTTEYPTPAPGKTYAPYVPGMIPTPAPGKTYAPYLIPTPAPGSTYAPGQFPTWVPGMVPTVQPGVTVPWWLIPTPAPGSTYAPFHYPTWVPGMIPTPAPGYTFAPDKLPTPAQDKTYAPGLYPTWVPGMVPTPAPGVTFAPDKIPTPQPHQTYAPGMYPTWVPGMIPTPAPGFTFAPNKIPTPAPGSTYAPGMFPTWVPGMIPTPAPGVTYAPDKIPTPGPGRTYAPGMFPTWVPGMAPTPAPGKTFAPDKIPTPAPKSTYAPGKYPTFIPGYMVPTPAPGVTFGPDKVPTPAPGQTYAPGMIPTWIPGMIPTPAPGVTYAPDKIPTPAPGSTFAPGMYPTWVPGMIPTPAPGMTFAPNKLPTPGPSKTYAPGMYPTWVPGMIPTPAPGFTFAPNKLPTPAPGSTYAPGMYPTWVPGMVPTPAPGYTYPPYLIPTPAPGKTYAPGQFPVPTTTEYPTPAPGQTYPPFIPGMIPTPAPGKTYAPDLIPTPAPGTTYAPGKFPTWVPGMVPTVKPGVTVPWWLIPTPAPGSTYSPFHYPTWVPGMIPTPAPGVTFAPDKVPTPAPGKTYAPGLYPTWVPGMQPTPAPGKTFAPNKLPTPAPGLTFAPGMYPTFIPGWMIPTPAPGVTFAPDKVPTPAVGQTYAPGMYPTWVPGMVPTPAPGMTYAPDKVPTPGPGRTYAPGMYPTWVPGMVPTPAPGMTFAPDKIPTPASGSTYAPGMYPTWVPGMAPTPAPGKTFAPDKMPTPLPGLTYAPGMYPTFIPGFMVPTPAPGVTFGPDKVPTPAPGQTFAPGMIPTWIPGMIPTPAPGVTYAPDKIPTPGPRKTYAPGMFPTWVPGMVPTPAPGMTYAPNKIPTPAPYQTYAPGRYPTWVPGMVPTPAPGYTYAPDKIPTPSPGQTYAPGMYPTWVPGMIPTPAPGITFAPDKIPTMIPGVTYPPGMYPTWVPGMVPTPAPGQTYAPDKIPTPAPGQTYAPGMFPVFTPTPAPNPTPYAVPTAIPGQIEGNAVSPNKSVSGCMYHGIVYGQDQKWHDGCRYDCECIDEHTGRFRCKERCPLYLNVPSYCRLIVDPNDACCKTPVCQTPSPAPQPTPFMMPTAQPQPGSSLGPTPGPGPQPTPQPSNVCVMDGKQYVAGQTWYNGCAQQCVCEDGMTGFYRCYDRCKTFNNVPSGCTMVADPKDPNCCEVPQCIPIPDTGVTFTPGPPLVVTGVTGVITGTNPPTSSPPSGPTPTPRNVCIYGGRTYQQGERWQDGCNYNCVCEDGMTGRYRCSERCATFPFVPPQCKMQRDPKDVCCFVPVCDFNQTVPTLPPIPGPQPSPGVSTQAPNTLPPSFCVYNGAPFFKGQSWDDGCTKKCRCDDADQNIITCFDRCTTYENIGANCVMMADPQDSCCQIPKCPTPPTGSITGGPQPNPITGVVPSNQGYCDYKGVHYQKGQTWDDGCTYTCQCIDDMSGLWQCDEKCPRYIQVPANCQMVQDPANKCCRKPHCPTPTVAPTPGPSGVPTPAPPMGVCLMNGQTYTQGQKWYDGCDQTCVCNDGTTGAYTCTDRCPTYSPQPGCTMVPDARDPMCCLAPQCPGVNVAGVTGGITGYGTPPTPTGSVTPSGNYCVYKGKSYSTGQRWQDGCQYDCECISAITGQYKCTDRCPRYPNLPTSCHLEYDPTDPCCQKPVCPQPTGLTPTPSTDVCVYHGVSFRQGQSISVGCDKVCVCEDGKTGRITCHERCKTYQALGTSCLLVTDPNDACCQVPSCVNPNTQNPNQIVTGVTGTITGSRLPDNNPYTGTRNVCIYKSQSYNQGQTWDDGCKYTCECLDASTGLYRCTEKCPSYPSLPSYCTLVQDTVNTCCQKPYCTPLVAPTPMPSPGGVVPTPGPSTNVCVYKGYTYAQGQQWYDGCSASCRCEDADKNIYRCQQRCSVYTNVQSGCTMVPDPKDPDCCEIPDCPIIPPVSPTPGIITFRPGPGGVVTGIGLVPTPPTGVSPSPGYRRGCLYKGMVFQKGQKFDDGCDYECECLDDNTGKYRCVEKCTKYTVLPRQCVLIQDPNKPCCQVPYCDYSNPTPFPNGIPTPGPNKVPTPGTGVITVAPYVVPSFTSGPSPSSVPQGYCVYKGVYYTQGQTWDDGCSKKCRCEDVNTGYYSCAQRCHTYTKPSGNCVLRADPNDACCLVPDCNQIPTAKPAPTGTLPPGISTTPAPVIVPVSISGSFTGIGTLPGSISGSNGGCVYKGVSYKQGQKWQDSCTYNCECIDAQTGQYRCTDRCPVYVYLPNPQCYLKPSPTDSCCKVAECSTVMRPTPKPTVTPSPSPTTAPVVITVPTATECVYINGQKYAKGATWTDGCSTCECKDPAGNQFICTNKCPAYSGLPAFCTLVQDPSDACCMKPQCNLPGVSLTPYIGGGTSGSATPPTSLTVLPVGTHQSIIGYGPPTSSSGTRNACVYQGTSHAQGQSWDDGCNYVCTCEDASTGRYKCLSKCPTYPSLPSYCRKINVPGQCCPTVTCDIPGYGTYTPVPQLTPGPVPTTQPGMSTPNPQIILVPNQGTSTSGTGYPGGGYYLPNATNPQVIGTLRDKCVYKNRLYNQGDKWDDGCDYKCECLDSRTGYYQCTPLCPIYNNLPSNQCYLVKAQGQCCSQPMCYDPSVGKAVNPLTSTSVFPVVGTFSGGFTGFRPGYPYSITTGAGNVCVYKGTVYHQGDRWTDGCDFDCECIDQTTGMYRCTAKCPTYTQIPPLCNLVTDPANQCCKKINCQPTSVSLPPGYHTVTPAPIIYQPSSGNCTDRLSDCDQYGQAVCTSSAYRAWADRNCRAYCGFCPSTSTSGPCQDKLSNCATYGTQICTSAVYRPWAQDNCKSFCGFCPNTVITPTPVPSQCVDKYPDCASLGKFYCTDTYSSWSMQNCQKYCDWCNRTTTTSTVTPSSIYNSTQGPPDTPSPAYCLYKGKKYSQDENWQDGCQYNCTCADASTGYYRCRPVCPSYSQLPSACHLETIPGQCCPRLNCPTDIITPTPEIIYFVGNSYCTYKGRHYLQGATWQDGCDTKCTCVNATGGQYSCGSLCLNWDTLPSECHLNDPPPGMCCKQPNCPAGFILNIQMAYKDQYPKSASSNYNYVR